MYWYLTVGRFGDIAVKNRVLHLPDDKHPGEAVADLPEDIVVHFYAPITASQYEKLLAAGVPALAT